MKRSKFSLRLWFLASALALFAWANKPIPASAVDRLRFSDTASIGIDALRKNWSKFIEVIAENGGPVLAPVALYERVDKAALANGRIDVIMLGPAEYVEYRSISPLDPIVGWKRQGYFAELAARGDGPVKTIEDLRGRRLALGPRGSTSRHYAPLEMLMAAGLVPGRDLTTVHLEANEATMALESGDIDAIAAQRSAITDLIERRPDLKLHRITRGPDLPPDVLAVAGHVDPQVKERLLQAVRARQPALEMLIKEAQGPLRNLRNAEWRYDIVDAEFDGIRRMIEMVR